MKKSEGNIVKVRIEDLKPFSEDIEIENVNLEPIKNSLVRYDYVQPIVINKDRKILTGYKVYLALKELKKEEVEVIEVDLSEEEAGLFRAIDNQTSAFAEWKDKELAQELREIIDLSNLQEYFSTNLVNLVDNFSGLKLSAVTREDMQEERDKNFVVKSMDHYEEGIREVECPKCGYKFKIGK